MKAAYGLPKKREEVINLLQEAYTGGNLEDAEYERRLEAVYKAANLEELQQQLFDFPEDVKRRAFPPEAPERPQRRPPFTFQEPHTGVGAPLKVLMSSQKFSVQHVDAVPVRTSNILGSQQIDLRGARVAASHVVIYVECILGETKINLHNPDLEGKQVELRVNGTLGEVKIYVPQGVQVRRPVQMLASEFSHKQRKNKLMKFLAGNSHEPEPETPFLLTITGSFLLGNIKVVQGR